MVMLGDMLGQTWSRLARPVKPQRQAWPSSSLKKAEDEEQIDMQGDRLLPYSSRDGEGRHQRP
jgi:hypothetical protein